MAYKKLKIKAYKQAAEKAYIYLKSKEFLPGYYIKSFYHYSDTLNVNASVAAFFEELSTINKDPELCAARDRAIFNVVRYQFKDGAYPYASPVRTFPYEHHLNYRCPHYHAITLYFLLLADKLQKNEYFKRSLPKAVKWMQQSLKSGKIKWIVGKHLFSLGVTGAYGYMYYCFSHLNNIEYMQLIEKRLNFLIKKRLVNRFEPFNFFEMIAVILKELVPLETISPTGFPLVLRLRRIKTILARYLKERVKIVESLYYSAQIFDCLTEMEATN